MFVLAGVKKFKTGVYLHDIRQSGRFLFETCRFVVFVQKLSMEKVYGSEIKTASCGKISPEAI